VVIFSDIPQFWKKLLSSDSLLEAAPKCWMLNVEDLVKISPTVWENRYWMPDAGY
jgi:hypothetical protein